MKFSPTIKFVHKQIHVPSINKQPKFVFKFENKTNKNELERVLYTKYSVR